MNHPKREILIFDRQLLDEGRYWLDKLSREISAPNLKLDFPRHSDMARHKSVVELRLPLDLCQKLIKLSGNSAFLLYTTLVSALTVCLYNYSPAALITVGSPSRRRNDGAAQVPNALTIVTQINEKDTFRQHLLNVRETLLEAYSRQRYPIDRLIKDLGLKNSSAQCPLFNVTIALREIHDQLPDVGQDLSLTFDQQGDEISAELEFDAALFTAESIDRFKTHLLTLLDAALTDTNHAIGDLSMLSETERTQLLFTWNETAVDYGPEAFLPALFEAQAARTPSAIAVEFEGQTLTYAELNRRANQLAHHLRRLGVGPETVVAVMMERSLEMVVSLFAVVKAGGAYLPLDPSYPPNRLAFMLKDAKVLVLLTTQSLTATTSEPDARVIAVDEEWETIAKESSENPENRIHGDNAAYVIYTSGSTGVPKGVINTHRGIRNRLLWMQEAYKLTPADAVVQKTPFTFDVSVWEFFWPLLNGARLVVARPGGHQDAAYLVELINQQQITTIHFVPSMLQIFLAQEGVEECRSVRQVLCSGERLTPELQDQYYQRMQAALHNLYGPTEAAIDVTAWPCRRAEVKQAVPIGCPIANIRTYILDKNLRPVPVSITGQLYICGVGLSRGYLGRPELTAEMFIPCPFGDESGQRMYRTGDLARYLPDGNIEFIGRGDDQVKVRGFRIELGEIETALLQHPAVKEAAVTLHETVAGDQRLVAYLVHKESEIPQIGELRAFLSEQLPEYAIPSSFTVLEAMPLKPSGKIDRRALPAPEQSRPNIAVPYVAPSTPLEESLVAIWMEVLGLDLIGVNDNFFELGGHSLLATRVISRVRAALHLEIPLRSLFESPTIAALALLLGQLQPVAEVSKINSIARGDKDLNSLLAELEKLSDQEVSELLASEVGAG